MPKYLEDCVPTILGFALPKSEPLSFDTDTLFHHKVMRNYGAKLVVKASRDLNEAGSQTVYKQSKTGNRGMTT